jgi:hypothetical protein
MLVLGKEIMLPLTERCQWDLGDGKGESARFNRKVKVGPGKARRHCTVEQEGASGMLVRKGDIARLNRKVTVRTLFRQDTMLA